MKNIFFYDLIFVPGVILMQYVPLHLHTENSLLDGAIRIKDLCKFAKENDMPAVAITDHGNMYGAIQMYETAKEMGIKLSNASGYSNDSVAELTLCLMLSLLRKIPQVDARTRGGKTKDGLVGNELKGKTIGIVGTGAIGMAVVSGVGVVNSLDRIYPPSRRKAVMRHYEGRKFSPARCYFFVFILAFLLIAQMCLWGTMLRWINETAK